MDRRFPKEHPHDVEVAAEYLTTEGIHLHRDVVRLFADGELTSLEFERESDNPHDSNAIKVIALWTDQSGPQRAHLGYLDRVIARPIASADLSDSIRPLLRQIRIWDSGYVSVRFDLVIEVTKVAEYANAFERDLCHYIELRAAIMSDCGLSNELIAFIGANTVNRRKQLSNELIALVGSIADIRKQSFPGVIVFDPRGEDQSLAVGKVKLWRYYNDLVWLDSSVSPPCFFVLNQSIEGEEPRCLGYCEDSLWFWLFVHALRVESSYSKEGNAFIEELRHRSVLVGFRWFSETVAFWNKHRTARDFEDRMFRTALRLRKSPDDDAEWPIDDE